MPILTTRHTELHIESAGTADRPPIILLHGILGSVQSELLPLLPLLSARFRVLALDFTMHGESRNVDESLTLERLSDNLCDAMDSSGLGSAHVFGYSLGGYVGLNVATHRPERIRSLMMHGTKFYWTPENAGLFAHDLDPSHISAKQPRWATRLAALHATQGENHWKALCAAAAAFVQTLPGALTDENANAVRCPVQVSIGDRDELVSFEEAVSLYRALGNGSLCIYPATRHPITMIDYTMLAEQITRFVVNAESKP